MIYRILNTQESQWAPLFSRVALGIMIFPHGAQKLLGWFGGYGFEGTMNFFTQTMGIPTPLAFLAIVAEFFGGLGLITGALTRISALGVGFTMAVAAIQVHLHNGFFMNWMGKQQGEGIEFFILAVGLALSLLCSGGGRYSVDSKLLSMVKRAP
ncbi:MAG: DoxX family protein [Planctomycetota bacterium]